MNKTKITKEDIDKALQTSSYLLEQRICPILMKHKYKVVTNTCFEDPDSGISRELDVDATRIINLRDKSKVPEHFEVELLIECKKNDKAPAVGFTRKETFLDQTEFVISCVGVPYFLDGTPSEMALLVEQHHYWQHDNIATMCGLATGGKRATIESHLLYPTVYKLCKAVSVRQREYRQYVELNSENQGATCTNNTGEASLFLKIIYPVVVFGGDFYECKTKKSGYCLKKTNHMLFFHSISSHNFKGTFLIDLIHESYLPKYLNIIEKNNSAIRNFLTQHIKEAKKSAYDDFVSIRKRLAKKHALNSQWNSP